VQRFFSKSAETAKRTSSPKAQARDQAELQDDSEVLGSSRKPTLRSSPPSQYVKRDANSRDKKPRTTGSKPYRTSSTAEKPSNKRFGKPAPTRSEERSSGPRKTVSSPSSKKFGSRQSGRKF
jgi:hypothetical protein